MSQSATVKQLRAKMLSRFCVLAGRLLILLSAVLLAITPMTAHFWTFDGFLRGGQDFEMGLLSVLAVLCLVLLLADMFRETLSLLIALREWIDAPYRDEADAWADRLLLQRFTAGPVLPPGPSSATVSLPLLI